MVEGPSFHFFPDNLMHNGLDSPETSKFKRKPEDGENLGNSLKLLKIDKTDDMEVDFLSLSLSLIVHQPYKNNNDNNINNDHLDTSSLIHEIGCDNSINCIAHCSRSDYGSIASLNRTFRSLTKSEELYKF
ncbi:hypothetical protein KSS87_017935, partial [Heliosperma pusillum]